MLDLIIPAYNAHNTICRTLLSVYLQTISDKINVYIIDDCSDVDYTKEIELFSSKLSIKQFKMSKNSGPGTCRQYGINHSNSKYIMFMDSDDIFYNCFSAENLLKDIYDTDNDLAIGCIFEETQDLIYYWSNHDGNLHGKIYRRKFIEDKKIEFNNTRSSEDNGFHKLVLMALPKIVYCNELIYIYKYNKTSITKSDDNYCFNMIEMYAYNMKWAADMAKIRKFNESAIAEIIFSSFFWLYTVYMNFINCENSDQILMWCKPLYIIYNKYLDKITEEYKNQIWVNNNINYIVPISFNEFLMRIKLKNNL